MTLRSLKIFQTVAELENMTKAAQVLFTTQSSISQVILDIEKEYHIKLFERFKNSLKLTPVGKEMLKYANDIINKYDELTNVLKQGSENPKIRIGGSVTAGSTILEKILSELLVEIPNLDYHTMISNTQAIEEGILHNEIDIAIIEGNIKSEDIVQQYLIDDPMVLICSKDHKFFGRNSVSLDEIASEPLIIREEGSGSRRQVLETFSEYHVQPNIKWTCSSQEIAKQLTIDNFGISVMTRRAVKEELENGSLWCCGIVDVDLSRTFRIVYHKDKFLTYSMKKFIEISKKIPLE